MGGRAVCWAGALLLAAPALLLACGPVRADATETANICVGMVVDATRVSGPGSPYGTDTYCATTPRGSTGSDVLDVRAAALRRPPPVYQRGLLCSIDGYPTTGCGDSDGHGGYRYWAYWHREPGAASWTYAGTGPDGYQPAAGETEGWAFQNGGPEGQVKPPLVDPASICTQADRDGAAASSTSSAAPTSAAATSVPASAPTPAGPVGGAGPTAGARGAAGITRSAPAAVRPGSKSSAVPRRTTITRPPAPAPATAPGQPDPRRPLAVGARRIAPMRTATSAAPTTAAPTTVGTSTPPGTALPGPVPTTGPATTSAAIAPDDGAPAVVSPSGLPPGVHRAIPQAATGQHGRGALGGLVLGGVAILGLAGAAGVVARRRRGGA